MDARQAQNPTEHSVPSPDPLAMTSEQFVLLLRDRVRGGGPAALDAYRRALRLAEQDLALELRSGEPVRVQQPRITRRIEEPSGEGTVIKLLTAVPAGRSARGSRPVGIVQDRPPGAAARAIEALDELEVESVLIPMIGRNQTRTYTLCVSSQVGCAMGCTFCETAQMGLVRSLQPREIVAQWFAARHHVGIAPKNIVFMGMGEPMDNLDAVVDAIAVLTDQNGCGVGMSHITVSTVGRVEGIEKLGKLVRRPGWHGLRLAVSLNAPNDVIRSEIMPINKSVPMLHLREAMLAWPVRPNTKICVEYVLIPGVNDGPEHARELAGFLGPLLGHKPRVMLNVIPYNPRRASPWPAPREEDVERFIDATIALGVPTRRRRTKGRQMMGACGQLGTENIRRRNLVALSIGSASQPPC